MNPTVLARHYHTFLVACLEQRSRPLVSSRHFTLYPRQTPAPPAPTLTDLILVHDFVPAQIDNNIGFYVANELLPLLAAATCGDSTYPEQELFERYVGAIVRSIVGDERHAWQLFYTNTLHALSNATPATTDIPAEQDFIGNFGAIYQHVIHLLAATLARSSHACTLLDVATCFGFLPLLLALPATADRIPPNLTHIVACDLNPALVSLANDYARHQPMRQVEFVTADILAAHPQSICTPATAAPFDIVTAIHLLEHLEPWQTELAITQLWQLTRQRLIIAVPLETRPDPRFGHRQVFDPNKLAAIGQQLGAPFRCFEYCGGWLVIDRPASITTLIDYRYSLAKSAEHPCPPM